MTGRISFVQQQEKVVLKLKLCHGAALRLWQCKTPHRGAFFQGEVRAEGAQPVA